MKYINGSNGSATLLPPIPTQTIVGAGLANRRLDKRQRACLCADVIAGLVTFTPSQQQLAHIFGVSVPYIEIARKLPTGKRTAILRGLDPVSFVELMPRRPALVPAPNCAWITNLQLEHVIRVAGIERVIEAACAVEHAA
jgi:hypothetical protein